MDKKKKTAKKSTNKRPTPDEFAAHKDLIRNGKIKLDDGSKLDFVSGIRTIPEEVARIVIQNVLIDYKTLSKLEKTSPSVRKWVQTQQIWRRLLERDYPIAYRLAKESDTTKMRGDVQSKLKDMSVYLDRDPDQWDLYLWKMLYESIKKHENRIPTVPELEYVIENGKRLPNEIPDGDGEVYPVFYDEPLDVVFVVLVNQQDVVGITYENKAIRLNRRPADYWESGGGGHHYIGANVFDRYCRFFVARNGYDYIGVIEREDFGITWAVVKTNPKINLVSTLICNVCDRDARGSCGGCNKVYYCSETCQSYDWKEWKHKDSCLF